MNILKGSWLPQEGLAHMALRIAMHPTVLISPHSAEGCGLPIADLRDGDAFVTAVRAALPKSRKFSSAEIARLKQEHAATLTPSRESAAEVLALERKLSDLVNTAFGLTPEEVAR
jgi:hypothetical protein